MSNTTASWRDELKDWIKNQHGTAGWEQKLENFIEKVEQEAYERGRRERDEDYLGIKKSNLEPVLRRKFEEWRIFIDKLA